jgi:hypothetical protein
MLGENPLNLIFLDVETMPQILEQLKASTGLPHPDGSGLFCLGEDGFVYLIVYGPGCYWIERLQIIRTGISFQEAISWGQYVNTGHQLPEGPRGGYRKFRSIKKAIDAIASGQLEWTRKPYPSEDDDRLKAYYERTSNDYLPAIVKWALAKGKSVEEACQRGGIASLDPPWKSRSESQLIDLLPR